MIMTLHNSRNQGVGIGLPGTTEPYICHVTIQYCPLVPPNRGPVTPILIVHCSKPAKREGQARPPRRFGARGKETFWGTKILKSNKRKKSEKSPNL